MEEKELPKELYHYTSLETFFNIITGKELWFFDAMSNYDKNEISYVDKKIKEVFKKKYNFDCEIDGRSMISPNYSLSLTSEADSYFHFHKYASENTGVCLCFDIEKLTSLVNHLYNIETGRIIDVSPIFYENDEELENLIMQEISNCDSEAFKNDLKTIGFKEKKHVDILENLYKSIYYKFAKITKGHSYKAEHEFRFFYNDIIAYVDIILNCFDEYGLLDEDKLSKLNLIKEKSDKLLGLKEEYKCLNGKIRKCCRINIAPFINQNIISKIIIGCKCKNTVDEIKAFLDFNNVRIQQVLMSEINID